MDDQQAMMPGATSRYRGFTLIEMAIVLGVIGVLFAVMLPTFRTWILSAEVRSAGESIESGLQLARGEAMRRNVQVQFTLQGTEGGNAVTGSAGTDWIIQADDQSAATPNFSILIQKRIGRGTQSVQIGLQTGANSPSTPAGAGNNMTTTATNIIFNGFGRIANPAAAATEIDLSSTGGGRSLAIIVGSGSTGSGHVRLCDPAFSISTNPQGC